MADDKSAVEVGGPYVESEDHVPEMTDMSSQFNTSGLGASGEIEEVAAVFTVDKVKTAEQVVAALDPDDDSVSEDKVMFQDTAVDRETEQENLLERAQARIDKGVVIGEPGPAEAAAAEEYDVDDDKVNDDAPRAEAGTAGTSSSGSSPAADADKSDDKSSSKSTSSTTKKTSSSSSTKK